MGSLSANNTSSKIQNEVIDVLQDVLKAKLWEKVIKAESFTVMMDVSSDRNWRKKVMLMLRSKLILVRCQTRRVMSFKSCVGSWSNYRIVLSVK